MQGLHPSGARGTRTPDLLGAIQALSQLSYSPGWISDCSCRASAETPRRAQTRLDTWSRHCGAVRPRGYAPAREMSEQGEIGGLRGRLASFRTRLRLFFVLI